VRLVIVASTLTPTDLRQLGYQPVLGAHIYPYRDVYSHHGIDCGDWTVIDFGRQSAGKAGAIIRRVPLAEFAQGTPIRTRLYGASFSPEVIVARAVSMIGRSGYHLFSNNCEHLRHMVPPWETPQRTG
jgi:hypothetical protein